MCPKNNGNSGTMTSVCKLWIVKSRGLETSVFMIHVFVEDQLVHDKVDRWYGPAVPADDATSHYDGARMSANHVAYQ